MSESSHTHCIYDLKTVVVSCLHVCFHFSYNFYKEIYYLCNSYTMGCPPVRGDNPRALVDYLTYRWITMV